MKNKLIIIGASGHGKVVADIALKMNKWKNIAFLDDNTTINSSMGLKVIGTSREVYNFISEYEIFVGIGSNAIRSKIQKSIEILGGSIPVLVHPNAVIGSQVEIGIGTAVMAGAVINSSTKIGKGCIINTSSTIDHDNILEDFVHISPGTHLAGTVKVGYGSWLGIGSNISNNVNISCNTIIGAGSVILKDITDPGTYAGVPVRKIN